MTEPPSYGGRPRPREQHWQGMETQTITWAPWVYGGEGVAVDDPAETFHEASSISPNVVDHRVPGPRLLERHEALRASSTRAVRRRPQLPEIPLPSPRLPPVTFGQLVRDRRSQRDFAAGPIPLGQLATLLQAAYGATDVLADGRPVRAIPSGGALYPLELYPVVLEADELEAAVYHFDPLRGSLVRVGELEGRSGLAPLTVYPELFVTGAVVVFVTAVFWRTRFKYGQRGYRFALLEAGHLGQNLLLAAAALELAAVAVGGFYDGRVNEFLGVDGVNEAALYAFSFGRREGAR